MLPTIRFPEFKNEWSYNLFSDVVTNKSKKFDPKKDVVTKDIELDSIEQNTGRLLHTYASDDFTSQKNKFEKGTVLYSKLRPYLNKYYYASIDGVCSSEIWVLNTLNKDVLSNKFLYYFIQTNRFSSVTNKSAGSKMPRADWGLVENIRLYKGSIDEQEKIGDFFSKLDRHIELEEKKLELLEQQKKGYMQKIFTQELKFENSQLENIKWSYKTLEELNSFFTDGNYGESYPKSEDMSDKNDGVAFLRGSNLKKGRITLEDANYISKKKHSELTTGHLFLDDIVIAVRGSLGAVGYVNENMVGNNINSQLAIIRTSSSLLYGKYLLYYLMSNQGKKELLSRVTGTALKQLPIKQIKQIKVPVPKLHEQHKIANFLSELDNLIDNQTEKMEILKQRKQGLLQKMFV